MLLGERAGGPERQILDSVARRAFCVVEEGIYHIARADSDGSYRLQFFEFATGKSRLLSRIETYPGLGLTVSPDRRTVLFAAANPAGTDLMLIENYR